MVDREVQKAALIGLSYFNPMHLRSTVFELEIANQTM